jgi:hypothetical protein
LLLRVRTTGISGLGGIARLGGIAGLTVGALSGRRWRRVGRRLGRHVGNRSAMFASGARDPYFPRGDKDARVPFRGNALNIAQ